MPSKTEMLEETASLGIFLPLTNKKKAEEKKRLFQKMKSLIERDKESLPIKDISYEKYTIVIDAGEFGSLISFEKTISIQIMVSKDLDKNKTRINDLANKLVNYMNAILGESAKNARITATLMIPKRKGINLARKVIEETRLARINELTKRMLNPKGICFGYKSEKHENIFMHLHDEKQTVTLIMSHCKYEDAVPWDFALEEYNNLKQSIEIIRELAQREF